MKRGLDTNVLIYAHIPSFEQHGRVKRFLEEQLEDPDVTLVVSPGILHEFIHIVTDARRFENPLTMSEASAVASLYVNSSNIECPGVDGAVFLEALDLMDMHRLGRKRLADTLFAAILLHHGVEDLITCNPRDFKIFEGLTVIDPS